MDIFKPDNDEIYDKRCGEIFLTTKGNITFHCTLCEMVYKNFEAYAGHLSEIHLTALKSFEDNTNQVDSRNLDTTAIPLLKVECELLENEFLKEVEVPIDSLIEDSDSEARNDIKDSLSDFEKRIKTVEIPNFSREARKQGTHKTSSDKSAKKSKQKQKSTEKKEDGLEFSNTFSATTEIHVKTLKILDHNNCQMEKSDDDIVNSTNVKSTDQILSSVKVESKLLEYEVANEDELPTDPLTEVMKSEEKDSISDFEKIIPSKENRNMEISLSKITRKAKKRTCKTQPTDSAKELKEEENLLKNDRKTKKRTRKSLSKQQQLSLEKNQDCLECRKNFQATTDGRGIHTCDRRYLCYHCGCSFLCTSHLNRHLKRHKNQRDYKCEFCEKAFYDSTGLKRHMEGHSNRRPFKCKKCPATFSRNSALQNHIKIHENKREYKCHLCEKSFNQHAGLFTHMKLTHKSA